MATNTTLNKQLKDIAATIASLEESIRADIDRAVVPVEKNLQQAKITAPVVEPVSEQRIPQSEQAAETSAQQAGRSKKPDTSNPLKTPMPVSEFKIGQKALLFSGIITMIFGVAFFLKYSFEHGWIGPAARVALVYSWGFVFLGIGHVIKQRNLPSFGLSLFGGGIAILYFAAYAALQIYHLLPQTSSFLVMVFITVLACAAAIVYETQTLAILGLIGGFGTPVLLSTGQDNYTVLFSYMMLLNLGILGISFKKRWVQLQYIGFAATWLVFHAWYAQYYDYELSRFWAALISVNLFYIIYSILPFSYHFLNREKHDLNGLYILVPNSFIMLAYNYFIIQSRYPIEWLGLVTLAYAFTFGLLAYETYRRKSQQEASILMLLKATFFLFLTVPLLLSKHWITIFWALQASVLLAGAKKLMKKEFFITSVILLFLALAKFAVYDLSNVFKYNFLLYIKPSYSYLLIERWMTDSILIASLYVFLRIVSNKNGDNMPFLQKETRPVFSCLFGALIFSVMTLEISAFFHDYLIQARFASISIAWTLFAMILMVLGFKKNNDVMRKVALGLLFVTLFKVFLFDISQISTPYRILSFIVLGLILIVISYLYTKAKQRLLDVQKDVRTDSPGYKQE